MIDLHVEIPPSAVQFLYWHRKRHLGDFGGSMRQDYQEILPYLPAKVDTILDIGCGLAGVDVLLKRHYPEAQLWLLDSDGARPPPGLTLAPHAGWNKVMEPFSSRRVADELLALNGVKADRWIDVGTKEALVADLVISLASWGFHYPLSSYNVKGFCIADLRKGQEPKRGKVIAEYPKRFLCAWEMK